MPAIVATWEERSESDIMLLSPFLARTVKSLTLIENESVKTMATDGKAIYCNKAWARSLTLAQVTGVRVHECCHVVLGHHARRAGRDPVRWNVAGDYEVNPYVFAAGYELPPSALYNPDYRGMSAEEIYEVLPPNVRSPSWGWVDDASTDPSELASAKDVWAATAAAALWGSLPGSLERALRKLIVPSSDLATRLLAYLSTRLPEESTSWTIPSRRYALLGGHVRRATGHIVACVDTSGSIPPDQLHAVMSTLLTLPALGRLDIIAADSRVQGVWENVETADVTSAAVVLKGGGGTDFRPALCRAVAAVPDVIVYFTDGAGTFPSAPPPCQVVWVMPSATVVPFGSSIIWP